MNFKPLSLTLLLLASTTTLLAHADERVCNPNTTDTAPDSRFQDIGNGEVKDSKTNLIWRRCSIGQEWNGTTCEGDATDLTWQQALQATKKLGNGYRLPNYKEAVSITHSSCKPAINSNIFPNMPVDKYGNAQPYWTSTPHARDNTQALTYKFGVSSASYHYISGFGLRKDNINMYLQRIESVYALPVRSEK